MMLMRARAAQRALGQRCIGSGTSLPIPKAPAGSEQVFHAQMMVPKYSLSNAKWFGLLLAANLGAYAGHYFYIILLMPANPPNPPRDTNQQRPERHMHSVDDE
eukprot:TRINITY_DN11075_c0_g1_i1.p3 TRINITY_DN11075_c0_g1~~TRINITY_DN11075_c0_g1_i1.p3  ORF type:complete len:103 (+),score=20.97 TRINITY_DN11075_c0_g1_i1:75-383(+)